MSDRWELNDVHVCHTTHQVQNNHLVRSNSTLDELSFNHLLYNRLYLDLLPLIFLGYFPWFFSVTSPKSWLDFSRLLPLVLFHCCLDMSGHVFFVPDSEYLFAPPTEYETVPGILGACWAPALYNVRWCESWFFGVISHLLEVVQGLERKPP